MKEVFESNVDFKDLGLRNSVLKAITEMGFEHPTDIQALMIPPALEGFDIIGQARTGTGKTAAFALPILSNADKDIMMQALILVPTRELAAQVSAEFEELGQFTPIGATCIVGGESMRKQVESAREKGQVMVGTPGRIMDLHARGNIRFDKVRFVVLDEVDRMLDIGFRDDIRKILKSCPPERQTIFVSATMDEEIERLARSYMKPDVKKIQTVAGSLTVARVEQFYLPVEPWDKRSLLLHLIRHEKPETTLVFCRTKATVRKVAQYLRDKSFNAREIHGDMPQSKRNQVMTSMRGGNLDILVASDLAARGLDVEHISHVINYDLPDDPEVYVHRIGRTARAGREGMAWTFVCPDQGTLLTEIEKLISLEIKKKEYPQFTPGTVPQDIRSQRKKDDVRRSPGSAMDSLSERKPSDDPTDGLTEDEIKSRFPGGVIPKGKPPHGLGSRFRTRRKR